MARGDVRRRGRAVVVRGAGHALGVRRERRRGQAARLRRALRFPRLPDRDRARGGSLQAPLSIDVHHAGRAVPCARPRSPFRDQTALPHRDGAGRVVHGDERDRQRNRAGAELPRQGRLRVDSLRSLASQRHEGRNRLLDRALDPRRGADGQLARRSLPDARETAHGRHARPRRSGALWRHGGRLRLALPRQSNVGPAVREPGQDDRAGLGRGCERLRQLERVESRFARSRRRARLGIARPQRVPRRGSPPRVARARYLGGVRQVAAGHRLCRGGAGCAFGAGQALEQHGHRGVPSRGNGPARESGHQARSRPRPPVGREGGDGFRGVQAPGCLFPLEPRDPHVGRGDALREGVRRALALRSRRAGQRRQNRVARALAVGYGGELAPRFRDWGFLLAGAPQARRQGPKGRAGAEGRDVDVGDEVVMFEEGKPAHPAPLARGPSSSEEGKRQLQDFPSFLKEGWRPKAAGVVRNRKPDLISRVLALVLCALSLSVGAQSKCLVIDPELQTSYSGGCKDGKAEGSGTARGSAVYVGEFHEGRKHGRGVKTLPCCDRYEGRFADVGKHGSGLYAWGQRSGFAGVRYEGGFANDKRNGYGLYVWASGDSYAGPWKDDAVAGRATPMMIARFRATNEALAAMSKPGLKLCHEATVGSRAKEWAQGEAQSVDQGTRRVSVRVTRIGPTPLVVAGTRAAIGDVVWDDPLNWIPCN